MTTQTKNMKGRGAKVPALRFPEFSGEWAEKKLGDIGDVVMCKRVMKYQASNSGDVPFFKIGTFGREPDAYITQALYDGFRSRYPFPKKGDILISASGTIGRTVVYDGEPAYFQDSNIIWLDNPESVVANKFLLYLYKKVKWPTASATIARLYNSAFRGIKITAPSALEQQKIAEFFGVVDEKIEWLSKKKESLERYKKGMMQKVFSQEISFKDENGNSYPDWDEKKMNEIGVSYNGLIGKSGEDFGEGEPFITYKQIFDNSTIDVQKFAFVKVGENEKQNRAQFGDAFFTTSSETPLEVGFASVLLDKNVSPYLNSFSFGFRASSFEELDPYFAKFFFRSSSFRRDVVRLAQGSTRYNISKIAFMKIKLLLPSKDEQQKIADFLTVLDDKISMIGNELSRAKEFKKGLLQQMFI